MVTADMKLKDLAPLKKSYDQPCLAVTIWTDFGVQKNKVCHCFHCFPIYLHEVMGLDVMILAF